MVFKDGPVSRPTRNTGRSGERCHMIKEVMYSTPATVILKYCYVIITFWNAIITCICGWGAISYKIEKDNGVREHGEILFLALKANHFA